MSDAPERIWACASKNTKSGVVTLLGDATFPVDGWQEYVRADAIEALTEQLAAARKDAEEAEAYAAEVEAERKKTYEALLKVTRIHDEVEAKLATCEKYRDAYAEFDRIGAQALRDLYTVSEALDLTRAALRSGGDG